MDVLNSNSIKQLAQLLKPDEETSDSSDDDLPKTGTSKLGPGDIKHVKVRITGSDGPENDACDSGDNTQRDTKAIWHLDEVPEIAESDDISYDPRQKPEYDIKYRQSVTTEDIYLQLNQKTPATASCESMLVSVILQGESQDDVDLQVSRHQLDVRSPLYRLCLPLPHPVHPDKCTAEWDNQTKTLTVTLLLNRELDFINF